jgi:hypothetical protein
MKKFKSRYIGKKISEAPYISGIFQSDKNGFYSKDALMYQDILQFSDDKIYFRKTELYNWLLRHNPELINDYKDLSTRNIRYSKKLANKKDRLDRVFNDLLNMKVIDCFGTTQAKKINTEVKTYSINKSGKLILAIIKNISLKNELSDAKKNNDLSLIQIKTTELENNYLNIYNLFMSNLIINDEIPYESIVIKEFLINLQNKKLFSKFLDYMVPVFQLYSISNIVQLVNVILNLMLNQVPERNLFVDLFVSILIQALLIILMRARVYHMHYQVLSHNM